MEILITRHGQTDWNFLKKIQGQIDIELNDTGRIQAHKTGDLIKNEHIDLIITSPLKRAKETAEIINLNFNVPIIEEPRLKERYFGKSEGFPVSKLTNQKSIHQEIHDIWNYEKNIDFNGIETMHSFFTRVYTCLEDITNTYKGKNLLLVTHGATSVAIICYFTKKDLKEVTKKEDLKSLENCEVIKFTL